MKVEQYKQKDQLHIYGNGIDELQSYDSLVVIIKDGKVTLGYDWDYSITTKKYVYMFLEEYSDIKLDNIKDKTKYINELINKGIIEYDETMR